jgi:hypothetical protein
LLFHAAVTPLICLWKLLGRGFPAPADRRGQRRRLHRRGPRRAWAKTATCEKLPFMADQPTETMPEDVRQAFSDAVRLFDRWRFDTPGPTLPLRNLNVSLSGVCDLVLAYKDEPLPSNVHQELLAVIDDLHVGLKEELTVDPSYAIGARCLDTLVQDRRAAIGVARSLSNMAC